MSGESVWPFVSRDDSQLMPRLKKEMKLKYFIQRNFHLIINKKWFWIDLIDNTSKPVAKFYSVSFCRIYYFRRAFFSNNCHCLVVQSLLHRLTTILYVIFHLSTGNNNHHKSRYSQIASMQITTCIFSAYLTGWQMCGKHFSPLKMMSSSSFHWIVFVVSNDHLAFLSFQSFRLFQASSPNCYRFELLPV